MREVVVTSYGLTSPLGHTVEEFTRRMFSGESGVVNIRGTDVPENFPVPYAALIRRETIPTPQHFKNTSPDEIMKSWLMTASAAESALAPLPREIPIDAIVYGTADGVSFELVAETLKTGLKNNQGFNFQRTCSESSVTVLKDVVKSMGFNAVEDRQVVSINSACSSGNQAIGIAFQGIRSGRWDRCLVGGVDARCEASNFLNFFLLGAVTTDEIEPQKASRPFAKDRSGFVRGEGAAVLLLESKEAALKRGAKILGYVRGFGCTSDAYRLTDGREDGQSVIEAMQKALRSAQMTTADIQYINAHGTSTPLNDRLETFAIKKVFGDRAYQTPVSSLKSQIGHSTIASSALEAIACLIMLQNQKMAPTINYNFVDPECDLDYVPNVSREWPMENVLSNSFGFGGQNACAVFGRA